MSNHFAPIMSKRSDAELIKIISIDRNGYEALAVEAAETELKSRHVDLSFVEDFTEQLRIQENEKTKKISADIRFVHWLVDSFFCVILAFVMAIASLYVLPIRHSESELFTLILNITMLAAFFMYYFVMELLFQRTVGKFITGTKVVKEDGSKTELSDILLRTICRFIPFDHVSFMVLDKGFHDSLSKTKLVKINGDIDKL